MSNPIQLSSVIGSLFLPLADCKFWLIGLKQTESCMII